MAKFSPISQIWKIFEKKCKKDTPISKIWKIFQKMAKEIHLFPKFINYKLL